MTQYSRSALIAQLASSFPDNTTRSITASQLRTYLTNDINSEWNLVDDGARGTILIDGNDTTIGYPAVKLVPADSSIAIAVGNVNADETLTFKLSTSLQTAISNATSNITILQGDITTIGGQITTINGEITTLNSEVAAIVSYPTLTWLPLTLTNSWTVSTNSEGAKYAIDTVRNIVYVRGCIQNLSSGSFAATLATLPVGARPNKIIARSKVTTDGVSVFPIQLGISVGGVINFTLQSGFAYTAMQTDLELWFCITD